MKKTPDKKRGLAPRSLVADQDRRSTLESLDRPRSPAAAFVRAALEDVPAPPPAAASPAPAVATPVEAAPSERALRRILLRDIDLVGRRFQYRVTRNLARLQESLLLQGQQVPVILRGAAPRFEIVSGFGRCDALALAHEQGKTKDAFVWADVRPGLTDREAHEISVIENEDREGLSELDRVNKAKKLKEEGYTVAEIASVLKKGERMVQYYLSLADAPARIGEALAAGLLRPTHALVLTKFSREALGELTPVEIEARLDDLIDRCARGVSVAELRLSIATHEQPAPRLLRVHGPGFELRGFRYSPDMPAEARRAILEALEEARRRVAADSLEAAGRA
jgi:ParB family chromosome partitioning protein